MQSTAKAFIKTPLQTQTYCSAHFVQLQWTQNFRSQINSTQATFSTECERRPTVKRRYQARDP